MTDHYASGRAAGIREALQEVANTSIGNPEGSPGDEALLEAHHRIEALLDQDPAPVGVKVKPLDLSNLLKHAFIEGRISVSGCSSFHTEAWVEYDPEESPAYSRILSALTPAPVTPQEAARVLLGAADRVTKHDKGKWALKHQMQDVFADLEAAFRAIAETEEGEG
ncbi:hypothetical protein [Pseudooceanicola atlanticus]|uniref:hypothetical protein n=1 Tax=Pseudooceanicola atlanticus TaxID=1461694 RepID=UPI00235618CC|nr:hypothetical protein [Pseudooceanicola atlanticus]